jgi:hypothetical protein
MAATMEKSEVGTYMAHLCGCAIKNIKPKELPESMSWEAVFKFAGYHSVANLTFFAIDQLEKKPESELFLRWKEQSNRALVKNISFDMERAEILSEFEQKHIPYLPLKGILIKDYYDKPQMRAMADNDILYKADLQQEVIAIMENRGYEVKSIQGNHDVYLKKPFYNFELHRYLVSKDSEYRAYFEKVWDRAVKDEDNSYGYHMKQEDFYIYIMFHFYKHYSNGGSGIRSLADILVFLMKFESQLDWEYIATELSLLKLSSFEKDMKLLAKNLAEVDQLGEKYLEEFLYIARCGTYGTKENEIKNKIQRCVTDGNNGSGFATSYFKNRLFPSTTFMKCRFPILEKAPILLPVYYIFRIVRRIFNRKFFGLEIKAIREMKSKCKKADM